MLSSNPLNFHQRIQGHGVSWLRLKGATVHGSEYPSGNFRRLRRLVSREYLAGGIYTVNQNERAVKTSFGRAERIPGATTIDESQYAQTLNDEEKQRYTYPQVRVIMPGGPVFQMAVAEGP